MNLKDLFTRKPKEIKAIEAKINQAVKSGNEFGQALRSLTDAELEDYRKYDMNRRLEEGFKNRLISSNEAAERANFSKILYEALKERTMKKLDWESLSIEDVKIDVVDFRKKDSSAGMEHVTESYLYIPKFRLCSHPIETLKREDDSREAYLEKYRTESKRVELQELGDFTKTLRKAFIERDVAASHLIFNYLAHQELREDIAKEIKFNKTKEKIRTRLKNPEKTSGVVVADKIAKETSGKGSGTPEKGRALAKKIRQER